MLSKGFWAAKNLSPDPAIFDLAKRIITAGEFHSYEWRKIQKLVSTPIEDPRDSNRVSEYNTHHCHKS